LGQVKSATKILFGKPIYYSDVYIGKPERFRKFISGLNKLFALKKINNPALKDGVCCSNKVLHSGFNTFSTALKGGVLNPSARIKNVKCLPEIKCERPFLYNNLCTELYRK
jgi:hypothetical protein